MPRISALEYLSIFSSSISLFTFSLSVTATAIGIIVAAVAVLLINMERTAVTTIISNMRIFGLSGLILTIFNEIHLSKPVLFIALDIMKPPRNRKITGSAKGASRPLAPRPRKITPITGISRLDATSGIASITQSIATAKRIDRTILVL